MAFRKKLLEGALDENITQGKIINANALPPTLEERRKALDIVHDFISGKGLILYGSTAIDMLLSTKGKRLPVKEGEIADLQLPDYDVYSPNPFEHSVEICNLLFDAGFKYVKRISAVHAGTFRIGVEFEWVLDMTFVPKHLFDRIGVVKVGGLKVPEAQFMKIDLYKGLTGVCDNFENRWAKDYHRCLILEQEFPLGKPSGGEMAELHKKLLKILPKDAHRIIADILPKLGKDVVLNGIVAYNVFAEKTGMQEVPLYSLDLFSGQPREEAERLGAELQKRYGKIKIYHFDDMLEHFPAESVVYVDDVPLIYVFSEDIYFYLVEYAEVGKRRVARYYDLLRFLYTRRHYAHHPELEDFMIASLIAEREKRLKGPGDVFGEGMWEIFGLPRERDYCYMLGKLRYEKGKKMRRFPPNYIPEKGKLDPVEEGKKEENLKILEWAIHAGEETVEDGKLAADAQ